MITEIVVGIWNEVKSTNKIGTVAATRNNFFFDLAVKNSCCLQFGQRNEYLLTSSVCLNISVHESLRLQFTHEGIFHPPLALIHDTLGNGKS